MIEVLILICVLFVLLYCLLIGFFTVVFVFYPRLKKTKSNAQTNFSIIIAARNEEKNIETCLLSVIAAIKKSASNSEIIVIDDNSTDATLQIIKKFELDYSFISIIELATLKQQTKKSALISGVAKAKNNWLLFTDADCRVNEDWLIDFEKETANSKIKMCAGPVTILPNVSFLSAFQSLDMFSMAGTSCAAIAIKKPLMCNGANLAVKKEIFIEASNQKEYFKKASGDDIFLLFYVTEKYGAESISYLKTKGALVSTKMQDSWSQLWMQRKRWISKSTDYSTPFMALISMLVYFSNLSLLLLGALVVISPEKKMYFFLVIIAKSIIDFIFLFLVAQFYKSLTTLLWFIPIQIVHIFYVTIVPLLSINSTYTWKGRKLK